MKFGTCRIDARLWRDDNSIPSTQLELSLLPVCAASLSQHGVTMALYCCLWHLLPLLSHMQALGFAGPSYIPKDPSSLWHCAVHQADVLFFWDAAEDWQAAEVGEMGVLAC